MESVRHCLYLLSEEHVKGEPPKNPEALKRRIEHFSAKIEQTLVAFSPKRNRTATQTAKTAAARKYVTLTPNHEPNSQLKSKDMDTIEECSPNPKPYTLTLTENKP